MFYFDSFCSTSFSKASPIANKTDFFMVELQGVNQTSLAGIDEKDKMIIN